jgi:hypothetical protein
MTELRVAWRRPSRELEDQAKISSAPGAVTLELTIGAEPLPASVLTACTTAASPCCVCCWDMAAAIAASCGLIAVRAVALIEISIDLCRLKHKPCGRMNERNASKGLLSAGNQCHTGSSNQGI